MPSRVEISVDRIVDQGPKSGFLEVQVTFEEKMQPNIGIGLAYVVVPLPKVETGNKTYEEIRKTAVAKAVEFLDHCIKSSGSHG